jgi:hypothetical protein
MAADTRHRNVNWNCGEDSVLSVDHALLAVLMDLRDELQSIRNYLSAINMTMHCRKFQSIPGKLEAIRENTNGTRTKKRTKKRAA